LSDDIMIDKLCGDKFMVGDKIYDKIDLLYVCIVVRIIAKL
jgi:hypothetical protein